MNQELNGTRQVTCDVTHIDDSSRLSHHLTCLDSVEMQSNSVRHFDDVVANDRTTGGQSISINRMQIRNPHQQHNNIVFEGDCHMLCKMNAILSFLIYFRFQWSPSVLSVSART
jgi:hypothetical protein